MPHLKTLARAWRRWVACKPAQADLFQLTAMQLGLFLQEETKRGPTVAPSRLRSFRWLREHVGLPFPVDAVLVQGFVHASVDHVPKQACALQLEDFWNLVALVRQGGPKRTIVAQLVLLSSVACIRCKHFARTRLQTVTEDMIFGFRAKGKRVQKGARPPYS